MDSSETSVSCFQATRHHIPEENWPIRSSYSLPGKPRTSHTPVSLININELNNPLSRWTSCIDNDVSPLADFDHKSYKVRLPSYMNAKVSLTFIRATTCHIRHSRQKNTPACSIANLDDEGSLAPSVHYYFTYPITHYKQDVPYSMFSSSKLDECF